MRKLSTKKEIKKKIIYKKKKCSWIMDSGKQCTRNSVGKTDLCEKHGGRRVVEDNLISVNDLSPKQFNELKFNPATHPVQFLQLSQTGMGLNEIATEMRIPSSTMRNWAETYEEFAFAFELGQDMHRAYYFRQGKHNMKNPMFQTSLFKFLAMNAVNFTDKIESKNLNINSNVGVLVVPDRPSVEEWERQNIEEDGEIEDAEYTEE